MNRYLRVSIVMAAVLVTGVLAVDMAFSTVPPTCPADISIGNDPGECKTLVDFPVPALASCDPSSGSFFPVGTTPVTCTDVAGQSCTFNVTVLDTEPPDILCPADITVNAAPGQTQAVVTYPAPSASDNCREVLPAICAPASGSLFDVGTMSVFCAAVDLFGNASACTFSVTVQGVTEPPTSTIVSEIHRENTGYSAGPPEANFSVVGPPAVTMGATIHDKATVTTTVNPIPSGSSVTFRRFSTADCTGTSVDQVGVPLTGGSMTESVESSSYLVRAANIPALSYNASFTSGNPGTGTGQVPNAGPSDCEPLTVASSITEFSYRVTSGPAASTQTYDCILEQKVGGECPSGTQEANVNVCDTNTYTVSVTVENNTGVSITEKVQGGLAAKANYTPPQNTEVDVPPDGEACGKAILNLSQASNVIIWGDGSTDPTSSKFSMGQGDSCTLSWQVTKQFASCGEQPITGSWSELQTLASGPNTNFSERSPYTGQLSVKVVAKDGSCSCGSKKR